MSILKTIILSIAPVSELRGGIPYALYSGMDPFGAFFIAVIANILIVPFIFLFLDYLHNYFLKIELYRRSFDKFINRTRRKTHDLIERYGYIGLAIFVAIPLPATGAWTGTLAAWFFGMNKRKSFFAISLGVIVAGIIVTIISYFGITVLKFIIR